MRLIDQIYCGEQVEACQTAELRKGLLQAEALYVDNVLKFYQEESPVDFSWKNNLSAIRLPWPITWMEGRTVPVMNMGAKQYRFPRMRWGALLQESGRLEGRDLDRHLRALRVGGGAWEGTERLIVGGFFIGAAGAGNISLVSSHILGVTELGEPVESGYGGRADFPHEMNYELSTMVHPFALALSFANCRNVTMAEVKTPEKLRRAHERRHKVPLMRYRVLEIGKMAGTLRSEGRSGEVGLAKALHICRGHFKTYTSERPLMGSRIGTYWWSAHTRGDLTSGRVVKDYAISRSKVEV